ncbi:MAG: hypothetical protein H0V81_00765 [Solirubrobacterales bacterium]|nr:hypothetical protein [Solirubrobacterales bacterium]
MPSLSTVRRELPPLLFCLVASCYLAAIGLVDFAFSDYDIEALPSATAIAEGRWGDFYDAAPLYGGSLLLRAPFARVTALLGGGELAVFRAFAVPAILAAAALGMVLFHRLRARSPLGAWVALALCIVHPLFFAALQFGHAEELLGGVLCAAAVGAAISGRTWLAGALLGAALANKAWAVFAVVPVLSVLPTHGDRLRAGAIAGVIAAAVMVPLVLAAGRVTEGTRLATSSGTLFHPWQLFWFLGEPGNPTPGAPEGARIAPPLIAKLTHPLVALGGLGVGAVWALARSRIDGARASDAALALALAFLTRCLLDTWSINYYFVPFVIVLLTWECGLRRRPPVLSGIVALATAASFNALRGTHVDLEGVVFLAWAVPLWFLLCARLFAPRRVSTALRGVHVTLAASMPSLLAAPAAERRGPTEWPDGLPTPGSSRPPSQISPV